ncbi:MAG: glycosyltransferase family 8 protein [Eubacterium sp.]
MNILVTLNSGYVKPLCTMLKSLVATNYGTVIDLYVAHSSLTELDFKMIKNALAGSFSSVHQIRLDDDLFKNAPTKKRISKETYYRIFAPIYLPRSVERILYIDPDTIILNSLNHFYSADFGDSLIIGAKHFDGVIDSWNRGRLGIKHSEKYINAGIMLLNIKEMRKTFDEKKVFKVIKYRSSILFLADQDLINILYDGKIKTVSEYKINLDERTFKHLLKRCSLEECLEFVVGNTLIVHYNGKNKPWNSVYSGYLKQFYDEYAESRAEAVRYEKGA